MPTLQPHSPSLFFIVLSTAEKLKQITKLNLIRHDTVQLPCFSYKDFYLKWSLFTREFLILLNTFNLRTLPSSWTVPNRYPQCIPKNVSNRISNTYVSFALLKLISFTFKNVSKKKKPIKFLTLYCHFNNWRNFLSCCRYVSAQNGRKR